MLRATTELSPATRELATYISGTLKRRLPAEVLERAKIHLVDTYAATISGSRMLAGKRAAAYVKSLGGKAEAGVIGSRIVTSAPSAAFANGMAAHADETDDTHPPSRTHPGSGVVPAVLAIGERNHLSGTTVLRALVTGYEVCARVMLAVGEMHFRQTGHFPSPFGRVFGAAAAAGALLGFDARKTCYMLSYAAQQAAALSTVYRDTEHVEKAFMCGMPSHNGVVAALVVAHGFTGVEDVFAGKHNFFSTYAPEADLTHLTRGLGRDFEIMRCGIKRWSAGGPVQAPLHVLYELMQKHDFHADDVEKLVARMPDKDLQSVDNRDMPDICVQHLLAVMLVDGTVSFKSAHDYRRMKDRKVLACRERVHAVGDPSWTKAVRGWRCAVEVTLRDGRTLAHETMSAKGGFDNPLNRQEEEEKALDLIAPVLGSPRAKKLIAALWKIDDIKDVRALRALTVA